MSSRLEQLYNRLEHISNLEGEHILSDAQELMELSRLEKKLHGEVLAFLIIGQYRLSRGEYKEAKKLFESALSVSEGHFEKPFRGRILSALGGAYCKMDQYGKSLRYLFEALEAIDPYWEGATYNTIGVIYRNLNQLDNAITFFERAKQKAKELDNHILHTSITLNIGLCYISQTRNEEAIAILEEAVAESKKVKYLRGQAYGLLYLLNIYKDQGATDKAVNISEELLAVAQQANDQFILGRAGQIHAEILFSLGQKEAAINQLEIALKDAQAIGYSLLEGEILELLCSFYKDAGNYEKACEYGQGAIKLFKIRFEKLNEEDSREKLFNLEEQILLLEQQKNKIAKQNKALKEYAYVVAHDLKEPLRTMSGFATMLYKKHFHTIDEQGIEYFQIILDSARFMHEKLEDLLTYATLEEKGQITGKVDLGEVVQSVINRLKHLIKETQSEIIIENELPVVKGNSFHFIQIFQNLIQNAIKFKHKERLPFIKIFLKQDADNLILVFQDNGIGIEEAFHDHIFKLFKRLDPQNYEGTGIGLAICQRVAEIYNGRLTVSSEFGKSTTFYLSLPKAIQI